MTHETESQWHLDRKVPIGLFAMIAIQTFTLIYVGTTWKSDIDNRIGNLEKAETDNAPNPSRILILEQKFEFIIQALARIEKRLDKDDERQ